VLSLQLQHILLDKRVYEEPFPPERRRAVIGILHLPHLHKRISHQGLRNAINKQRKQKQIRPDPHKLGQYALKHVLKAVHFVERIGRSHPSREQPYSIGELHIGDDISYTSVEDGGGVDVILSQILTEAEFSGDDDHKDGHNTQP
jgi:hypothetical protein